MYAVIVAAVKRLIADNLATLPGLAEIARSVGTYREKLSQIFREQTGMTVFAFIREARIRRGEELLRDTDMDVQDIALLIGFNNAGNFATAFRERTGDWSSLPAFCGAIATLSASSCNAVLGIEDADTNVRTHPYGDLDYRRWTAWWGAGGSSGRRPYWQAAPRGARPPATAAARRGRRRVRETPRTRLRLRRRRRGRTGPGAAAGLLR